MQGNPGLALIGRGLRKIRIAETPSRPGARVAHQRAHAAPEQENLAPNDYREWARFLVKQRAPFLGPAVRFKASATPELERVTSAITICTYWRIGTFRESYSQPGDVTVEKSRAAVAAIRLSINFEALAVRHVGAEATPAKVCLDGRNGVCRVVGGCLPDRQN